MSDLLRPLRLQVMLLPAEIAGVEDFRFTHRLPSRAAAVRELLKRGLAATAEPEAVSGKSSCYGLVLCPDKAANSPDVKHSADGEGVDPS
jgi:hypothetical protein